MPTLANRLKEAGYHTAIVGKWHLGLSSPNTPTERGFDHFHGFLGDMMDSYTTHLRHGTNYMRQGTEEIHPEGHATELFTQWAIDYLGERAASPEQPFFLYLAYNAPHYPLHAKQPDVEKYLDRYVEGWDVLRAERHQRQLELGIIPPDTPLSPRPPEVPAWADLDETTRQEHILTMAAYAGMIDSLDQNIGRVIEHLESTGEFENTIFLFMSDNGGCPFQRTYDETREQGLMPWDPQSYWTYDEGWAHASNTPFRWYKQNQHEGGISSPFIAHWPAGLGGEPGRIVRGPGHLIDIAATLYDIAGAEYPATMDGHVIAPLRGHSLTPILAGEIEGEPREYWQQFRRNLALRRGDWKIALERRMDPDAWELFNLAEDRAELNDLSAQKPVLRQAMIDRYFELEAEITANQPAELAVDPAMF